MLWTLLAAVALSAAAATPLATKVPEPFASTSGVDAARRARVDMGEDDGGVGGEAVHRDGKVDRVGVGVDRDHRRPAADILGVRDWRVFIGRQQLNGEDLEVARIGRRRTTAAGRADCQHTYRYRQT